MRTFLFAVDFSECSKYALDWALQHFIMEANDQVILLNIIDPPPQTISARKEYDHSLHEEQAKESLHRLWEQVKHKHHVVKGLVVELKVEVGAPKEKLVECAAEIKPTMLIVGNHGKTGSVREIGSVSDHCLKKCPVPVIVVKEPYAHK